MSTRGGMIYLTVWVSSSVNCLFMSFEEFLFCVIFSLLLIGFLGICCKLEEGLHLSGLILQSDEMSLQLTLLISLPILFVSLEWIISFWNEKYKAMAPHSSTLAWKIPWTEEPGRLQSMGSKELGTTERLHFHFSLSCIEEGNGNPLQCSCLENPRDGEAWWAAVYGVAQSQTWLMWLSSSRPHQRSSSPNTSISRASMSMLFDVSYFLPPGQHLSF